MFTYNEIIFTVIVAFNVVSYKSSQEAFQSSQAAKMFFPKIYPIKKFVWSVEMPTLSNVILKTSYNQIQEF